MLISYKLKVSGSPAQSGTGQVRVNARGGVTSDSTRAKGGGSGTKYDDINIDISQARSDNK